MIAKSTPLQTDVAVRQTVEAKDIELLSFSGRNPIGVVGLKAGVMGGAFNSRTFNDLGNGGFNINGSRADENTISIDGAVAVRTRSSGAIVGIQNVDAVQEVQVLTANYMPEFGRASGGQIRFVTKSGSNRYTGSASFFLRDDSLQANTWARNRSTNPAENSGPAPFNYKQYGYAFGGPVPISRLKDRFFFFGAQEFVDYFAVATNALTVPTEAMRRGDFSELLNPNNGFLSGVRPITDPLTGQPFPGNVIPTGRLSPNGLALLNTYPAPTPGFRQGTANVILTSENPQDQRKDTIRLDYRLTDSHQLTYRYSGYSWVAVDPFRPNNATGFPFARTDWDRPNATQVVQWTGVLRNNLVSELNYSYSLDEVFIDVFTEPGLHQRSRTGINYPYLFPGKEIEDKLPTISIAGFGEIDGGPYPAFSRGPIHTFSNTNTLVKGRHTLKAGVVVEYSGEDDFDQINVAAIPGGTNNQNGRFEFLDNRPGGTGVGIANVALGLFSNYAEIGQRALTEWRALATDVFIQDSWKPTSKLTVEGGVRWAFWPPWYSTTNNIANFDPRFYDPSRAAIINPSTGRLTGGDRFNGIVLPGEGFEGEGNDLQVAADPRVQALFRGEPRGFSEMHNNALEPRLGIAYCGEREDGRARQRRRVPQSRHAQRLDAARRQSAVPADGHGRERHRRQPRRGHVGRHGPAVRHDVAGYGVQAPDLVHVGHRGPAGGATRVRDGRQLCRPPRAQSAARIQHQPVAARNDPGESRREHRGAPAVPGIRRHPSVGKLRQIDVPQPAGQRRPPLQQRLQARRRLYAEQVRGRRQQQA